MDHKREDQTPPLARVMGVGRQQQGKICPGFLTLLCGYFSSFSKITHHTTCPILMLECVNIRNTACITIKKYILLLVYRPFSDRVGLPLNFSSPVFPVMDIFSVDLKCCHVRFTLSNHILLGVQPVFWLQLYIPYISSPSPHHFFSSHVHTISTYHF